MGDAISPRWSEAEKEPLRMVSLCLLGIQVQRERTRRRMKAGGGHQHAPLGLRQRPHSRLGVPSYTGATPPTGSSVVINRENGLISPIRVNL